MIATPAGWYGWVGSPLPWTLTTGRTITLTLPSATNGTASTMTTVRWVYPA